MPNTNIPVVMGVNSNGEIYYANTNIKSNPNWTKIGGQLKNVSYSNGQVYGVNSSGEIYYNSNYTTSNWVKIPGALYQVSFDGYAMVVIGVNSGGEVYYANTNITNNNIKWKLIGNQL